MSLPEVLLWRVLRTRPMGVKFRRQHPIGGFVLDFYCAQCRIGIEIDGIAHDAAGRPERDAARGAMLEALGVEIIRVPAAEVLKDVARVAESLTARCATIPPPSALRAATSPIGGGFEEAP